VVDVVASIILMVVSLALAAGLSYVALFLVVASDSCAQNPCNYGLFTGGWLIALLVPLLFVAISIAITVVRLVRRRRAWVVPAVTIVVTALVWWGALQMVFVAVPDFTL
jgi:hypothetical protein